MRKAEGRQPRGRTPQDTSGADRLGWYSLPLLSIASREMAPAAFWSEG